jgi:uroporphyrinogen-III synthase
MARRKGFPGAGPLAGFTVAVTADRRRDVLADLIEAQGARVVAAPVLRVVAGADDGPPTDRIEGPSQLVLTAVGCRPAWMGRTRWRWAPAEDPAPLRRLVDRIGGRRVDAVTFGCPQAARLVLDAGGPPVLARLRDEVTAACIGPVAAQPLASRGVPVVVPDRPRLDALVRALVDELPRRAPSVKVAGAVVTLRGHAAVVDDALKPLAPGQMAVLRALAEAHGEVLSRTALRLALPGGADEHTVEMAVSRLRIALGGTASGGRAFVETVPHKGFRLVID